MGRQINVKHLKNNYLQEVRLPLLVGMALRVSQMMGAAPVRMRRVGGAWTLAAAPRLAKLLMLLTITINIVIGIALILDFLSKYKDRARIGTTALSAFIGCTELVLLAIVHILGTLKATDKVKRLMTLMQHTQELRSSPDFSVSKKEQLLKVALLMYLIWQMIANWGFEINSLYRKLAGNNAIYVSVYLYGVTFQYQNFIIAMKQLQFSLIITELSFALTSINNRLKHLLQDSVLTLYSAETKNWNRVKQNDKVKVSTLLPGWFYGKESYFEIRRLARHYETVYKTLRQMDADYGPFLMSSFALIFLQLLITCYNFLTVLEAETGESVIWQSNWCIYHICSLVVMVEPCYWVLNQMDHTPSLLSRLVRRVGRSDGRVSKELNLFILDVQTGGPVLAPMGLFTISRPIVASIIGNVSTYLAIIVQMQKRSEM